MVRTTGFTTTTDEMEVKPGGVWRFVMHGPDGTDYKNKIVFLSVVRPERLVYRHAGDAGTDPVRFHVTVTFAAQGSKTRLTMASIFETAEERNRVVEKYGAIEGGKQTLSRLAEHLARLRRTLHDARNPPNSNASGRGRRPGAAGGQGLSPMGGNPIAMAGVRRPRPGDEPQAHCR